MISQNMLQKDYMTLSETAEALGKSAQTVRRMIKKGLLKAQRMRTPQGFNYVVYTQNLGANGGASGEALANEPVVTSQNEMVVGQTANEASTAVSRTANTASEEYLENDYYVLENLPVEGLRTQDGGNVPHATAGQAGHELLPLVDMHHKEKMMLFHILEELQAELSATQAELMAERSQPKSLFGRIMTFLGIGA
jgi:hypothetical protein